MHIGRRTIGIVLGGFALALGLLMVYTLTFEVPGHRVHPRAPAGSINVPVFFLERSEWRIFARGVAACAEPERGLGRLVVEDDDVLVMETVRHRRPVRFTWHGVRGERQAREEVRKAVEADAPIAVIGASNTVTTLALARGLRDLDDGHKPLLLVPWATSVGLLAEYPGRTFRLCANNRRLAGLLIDCLKARPGHPEPGRVEIVVDRLDPYSVDLAECFRREIDRAFPKAEVLAAVDETAAEAEPRFSGRGSLPTEADGRHARAIWNRVSDDPARETWVVLPLQNDPARRMLLALNAAGPGRRDAERRPLTVVCGDAVGPTTLSRFASGLAFPVWSASASSDHAVEGGLPEDVMEQAEAVAALLIALDRPGPTPTPDGLRAALLHPEGNQAPAPFGRPLAFGPTGERLGFEPGEVFQIRPDAPEVFVYADGHWTDPRPVGPGGAP